MSCDSKFKPPNKKSKVIVGEKQSTYKREEKIVSRMDKNHQAKRMMEKIDKRKSEERKLQTRNKVTTKRSSSVSTGKKEKSPKKSRESSCIKKEIEISESCDLERSLESGEALSSERQDLEPISDEESQEAPPASTNQWKVDNKLYNSTKLSILNNIGRYRKALSARSELQIRRKLCGLYDEPPQHLLINTSEMGVPFNAEVFNLAKKLVLEPEIAVT
uniref:Uncharacterized protein n=1 Tax=Romanomermis culicivorax TaxID=13658 RepID=A0A915IQ51_ROMCU